MAQAPRDQNRIATLLATSTADGVTPIPLYADPVTHRLIVDLASGSGTVTSVAVDTANGFTAVVTNPTTSASIELQTTVTGLIKGDGTAISAATADVDYLTPTTASSTYAPKNDPTFTGTVTIPSPFTLGATSVTTTGAKLNFLTSAGGTTGTTSTNLVFSTSPTLVTPVLGAATATTINKVAITAPATGSTLTIADGKTLTVSNDATVSGTNTGDQNPAGSNGYVQYYDGGVFGGDSNFTWDKTTRSLGLAANTTSTGNGIDSSIYGSQTDIGTLTAGAAFIFNYGGSQASSGTGIDGGEIDIYGGDISDTGISAIGSYLGMYGAYRSAGDGHYEGGGVDIIAGRMFTGEGNGGKIYLQTGSAGTSGNRNGGDIQLVTGIKSGSGTDGYFTLQKSGTGIKAIFNLDNLASSNKTFTFPNATGTFSLIANTETLTNKRVTKRVVTVTQSATPTINTDNTDVASITGLAQAITSMTTNLSGTPVAGDLLMIQITDNGTARAITWGASFQSTTISLPTTTVISTMLRVLFQWNTVASKWDCLATA